MNLLKETDPEHYNEKDCKSILKEADLDLDGKVSFHEVAKLFELDCTK